MLVFATDFPVKHDIKSDDFIQLIQSWLLGSHYNVFTKDDFRNLFAFNDNGLVQKGNQKLDLIRFTSLKDEAIGVRYTKPDTKNAWITNAVLSRSELDTWFGIRIFCESKHPAIHLPKVKKPILIRTLFKEFGGALDGELIANAEPIFLQKTSAHIDLAARLISGNSLCRLPIVYVSIGFQENYILNDIPKLASDLAGMAHVVVEPSRSFSMQLRSEVDSENVYGGTIGIYWPDGGGRRSYFLGGTFPSPKEIADAIYEEIQKALTHRRAFERCTWSYVQENISHQKIEELKASGSKEIEKYIETFDQEIEAKDSRLKDAEKEIERLKSEIRKYEAIMPEGGVNITFRRGEEQDLYENEVFGIIRDAVSQGQKQVVKDSRRMHILQSFLDANSDIEDSSSYKREQLKKALKGYSRMDKKVKNQLSDIGFSITEDGKHYKLVFQGDDRYTYTLPKSGSDYRGGANAASNMGNLFF